MKKLLLGALFILGASSFAGEESVEVRVTANVQQTASIVFSPNTDGSNPINDLTLTKQVTDKHYIVFLGNGSAMTNVEALPLTLTNTNTPLAVEDGSKTSIPVTIDLNKDTLSQGHSEVTFTTDSKLDGSDRTLMHGMYSGVTTFTATYN